MIIYHTVLVWTRLESVQGVSVAPVLADGSNPIQAFMKGVLDVQKQENLSAMSQSSGEIITLIADAIMVA